MCHGDEFCEVCEGKGFIEYITNPISGMTRFEPCESCNADYDASGDYDRDDWEARYPPYENIYWNSPYNNEVPWR